jgi:hypothetical protein
LALALTAGVVSSSRAADIVTMPTANTLKAGQVQVAYYHLWLDYRAVGAPEHLGLGTIYYGATDRLQLDAWVTRPGRGSGSLVLNPSFVLVKESSSAPNIVVGAQDVANALDYKTSAYLAMAKTITNSERKLLPMVRLHLGAGTNMNHGVFGGLETTLYGPLGAVVTYSQNDKILDNRHVIAGLTFTFPHMPVVLKGGVLGRHTWVGIAYTMDFSK